MKFQFNLKNKFDLTIIIAGIILLLSGAFLRFFKYIMPPTITQQFSYFLGIEFILFLILLSIKIWRI
jgi:hypothetical protein